MYQKWCVACHGAGEMYPGIQALAMLHEGQLPPALAECDDLDGDHIEYVLRNGISIMPFFRMIEISQDKMEALKAFQARNNPE